MREIVLDTETTGFDPKTGDRLIEVGCIEIMDLLPTGRTYHTLVNPERLIPPDAIRVHGITDDKVKTAPKFREIVADLMEFVGDAPIIAHNAAFDRAFVNWELGNCGRAEIHERQWIDTLSLAKQRFPGMHNSLDALCKRFKISLSEREKHGALIDAKLLAAVYLELKGGRERRLELSTAEMVAAVSVAARVEYGTRPRALAARSTEEERAIHAAFIRDKVKGEALWSPFGIFPTVEEPGEERAA